MNSIWSWRRPTFDTKTNPRPETPAFASGSISEALCSIFGDEEVSDVILQGCDGGTVVAVKAILASRSTMFRRMFFGDNSNKSSFVPKKEPGEKEVIVFDDWDCRILHLVVEYCYTDTCSAMKSQPTEEIARVMATLRIASKSFKLPGLLDKIRQWVWKQISRYPAIACAMVDEGMRNDDVDELALQTLQLKTRAALLPDPKAVGSGVLALSKPGLLFVLRTLEETTSHHLLLQIIERWVDFSPEDCSGDDAARERASRETFARKCTMRFIKLSSIPQENLGMVMKTSNLFTTPNSYVDTSMTNAGLRNNYVDTSMPQRGLNRYSQSTSVLSPIKESPITSTNANIGTNSTKPIRAAREGLSKTLSSIGRKNSQPVPAESPKSVMRPTGSSNSHHSGYSSPSARRLMQSQ